jgi:uncharacterized iron-regulated membrane protein
MTKRRDRIDSPTAAVKVLQATVQELAPPAHVPLAKEDEPFWQSVLAEKPKSEWTAHDLELAAMLARSMRMLQAEDAKLFDEDAVMMSAGGTPMANPRLRIVADLHSRVLKFRQTLGIHNRGKAGEQRDVLKRREQAKAIEDGAAFVDDDDDLIARPTAH